MPKLTSPILPLSARDRPLLVSEKQAAAMCGKSLRTWRTWDSSGLIPRPVRIAVQHFGVPKRCADGWTRGVLVP